MSALRPDLQAIASLVPEGACVLDIGCGEGELLAWLTAHKRVRGRGIELSQSGVNACLARGLSVVQGNAETDLADYPDHAYDVVVLSQTLQTLAHPDAVLRDLVRIARRAVVSVPNFGHWKNRLYLLLRGRMPVTKSLSFAWYDTPNIHFCTITDFIDLCDALGLHIEQQMYVTHQGLPAKFHGRGWLANLFGEQGIFLLGTAREKE